MGVCEVCLGWDLGNPLVLQHQKMPYAGNPLAKAFSSISSSTSRNQV